MVRLDGPSSYMVQWATLWSDETDHIRLKGHPHISDQAKW